MLIHGCVSYWLITLETLPCAKVLPKRLSQQRSGASSTTLCVFAHTSMAWPPSGSSCADV